MSSENLSERCCSNRTLPGMLAKQYLNSETADIYFRIGSDEFYHDVPAHRFVLAAVKSKFLRLFHGQSVDDVNAAGGLIIKIDYGGSVSGFEEFLQLFYRPEFTLTMKNISDVLHLCEICEVQHGFLICERFLRKSINNDNIFILMDYAIRYALVDLRGECETILATNTATLLNSESFKKHCSESVFHHVIAMPTLSCTEYQLFSACIEWLKCSCRTMDITREIIESHLGDKFYDIRFPLMTIREFVAVSHPNPNIFLFDEYESIVNAIVSKNFESVRFKSGIRQLKWNPNAVIECNRSEKCYYDTKKYVAFVQATEFEVSKALLLGEFVCRSLYLQKDLTTEMTITEVHSNASNIVYRQVICLSVKAANEHIITMEKPILIRSSGIKYKIQFDPAPRHRIMKLASRVEIESRTTVKFMNKSGLIALLRFNRIPNFKEPSDDDDDAIAVE